MIRGSVNGLRWLFARYGDKTGIEETLRKVAHVACLQGDYAAATACYEATRSIQLELGIQHGPTAMLHALGWVAYQQGDYDTAVVLCQESLALSRTNDDKISQGMALRNLGYIAFLQGERERAQRRFKESLGLFREIDRVGGYATVLVGLAILAAGGEPERAARLFGTFERVQGCIEKELAPADRACYLQSIDTACRQLGEQRFAAAWAEGRAMTLEQAVAYVLDETGLQ